MFRTLLVVVLLFAFAPASVVAQSRDRATAGTVWDDGRVTFNAAHGLVVATETLTGFEGPVDLITIHPTDPDTGERIESSHIALLVFRRPVTLGDRRADAVRLRDWVFDGLRARHGALIVRHEEAEFTLGEETVQGLRIRYRVGASEAQASLGALQSGPWTLVFHYHRARADGDWYAALNEVASSLRFARR